MSIYTLSDDVRRIRAEERRDPVDRALYAVASLTREQRYEMAARFNRIFGDAPSAMMVLFDEPPSDKK